jgi:hypothetical protein
MGAKRARFLRATASTKAISAANTAQISQLAALDFGTLAQATTPSSRLSCIAPRRADGVSEATWAEVTQR